MTSSNEAAQMPVIEHAEDLSPTPKPLPSLNTDNRLSLPYPLRLPLATFAGFVTGFSLGAAHGGKMAGLRFRAENAHRLPKDTAGWYLYHKSKNYSVMLGSLKEGLWAGGKLAAWVGGFLMVEEAVDRVRGQRDFVSTVVAGWGTSGAWSLWSKLEFSGAMRLHLTWTATILTR